MNVFSKIKQYLQRVKDPAIVPEGFCPNCWGRQEYGGEFFEAIHNEKIDLNNIEEKKGWIEAYAAKHLTGIQLKEDDGSLVCPSCKISYRQT